MKSWQNWNLGGAPDDESVVVLYLLPELSGFPLRLKSNFDPGCLFQETNPLGRQFVADQDFHSLPLDTL